MQRLQDSYQRCIDFHGHGCPGLAIGFRAATEALKLLNAKTSKDEELVCVAENDACGVDAVQVITGCSIGKGNLIYRDRGKQAFSFFNRATGDKVRIVFKKQLDRDSMDREALQKYVLNAPFDELFDVKVPMYEMPVTARLFKSIECEMCGERAAEAKMRLHEGKKVCLDCFAEYSRGWGR